MPSAFFCSRCGKKYKKQVGNFPASKSPLNKGNGYYMTICNHCLEDLFDHYKAALGGDEKAAMRRICLKLDIYWNEEIYGLVSRTNTSASRIKSYISRTNLVKFTGKTYDDTLDEESIYLRPVSIEEMRAVEDDEDAKNAGLPTTSIDVETVLFWGSGFTEDNYHELNNRYEYWTRDLQKPLPTVEEALYKQVCLQEFVINRNIAAGKSSPQDQKALSELLGNLNIKPSQKAKEDESAEFEETPMGVWIKRWEDKLPVPEYHEKAGEKSLIKYITTWFYGHTAKSLGIRNMYSQVYEDEIERYRVTKPEFEEESDDDILADLVGGDEE